MVVVEPVALTNLILVWLLKAKPFNPSMYAPLKYGLMVKVKFEVLELDAEIVP